VEEVAAVVPSARVIKEVGAGLADEQAMVTEAEKEGAALAQEEGGDPGMVTLDWVAGASVRVAGVAMEAVGKEKVAAVGMEVGDTAEEESEAVAKGEQRAVEAKEAERAGVAMQEEAQ
jgi:hypothetical protein